MDNLIESGDLGKLRTWIPGDQCIDVGYCWNKNLLYLV